MAISAANSDTARRTSTRFDGASLLTIYMIALVGLQSRLVVGPLGGAGQPATLVACAGFLWWTYLRAQSPIALFTPHPLRIPLLSVLFCFGLSLVAALSRPINGAEYSTAMLGMISVLGWVGIGLVSSEGIPSVERLDRLIGRLVVVGTALACLGVAQFFTHDPIVTRLSIPGLSATTEIGGVAERGGFSRPAGTAIHPIEFGSAITMILPLAIIRARRWRGVPAIVRWAPPAVMSLAVFVSISRSAILSAFLGVVLVSVALPSRSRRNLAAAVVVLVGLVALTIPGMIGTLRGLFTSVGNDQGVSSRTDSYPLAWEFIARAPFFGRGYATFLPSYRIFDNQYLLMLVEVGFVGTAAVLAVITIGIRCSAQARRRAATTDASEQAQALLAGVCAGAGGLVVFDGFSFPMSTGLLFLVIGLCGASLSLGPAKLTPAMTPVGTDERSSDLNEPYSLPI